MNPKSVNVRMDRETGQLWLTEEKYRKPIRKIADITGPVLLAMCAESNTMGGPGGMSKDVRFADGSIIRITVENVDPEEREISAHG